VKLRLFLYCLFGFLFFLRSTAQEKDFEFENFTQANGLPSNESYFVYRDSKNFLWIATDQGVVRYGGNKMERFDLPDNVVFKIREDNKGRIWFFSHTGKLAYFFNGVIKPYKYNNQIAAYINNILIMDAYVNDSDDVIIAGKYQNYQISGSGKIEKYENYCQKNTDTIAYYVSKINDKQFLTQQKSFTFLRQDTVFIGLQLEKKIVKYTVPCRLGVPNQYGCIPMGKDFFFFASDKIIKLKADGSYEAKQLASNILSLHASNDNTIWVGMLKHGAVLLDTGLNEIQNSQVLANRSISSITNDHEGGTWFSSLEKGVYYLKNIHLYNLKGDSCLNQPVLRLCSFKDSSFLFANVQGVYRLSHNVLSTIHTQSSQQVSDLFTDENNNVYLAGKLNLQVHRHTLGEIKVNHSLNNYNALLFSSSEVMKISKYKYLFSEGVDLAQIDLTKTIINNVNNKYIITYFKHLLIKPTVVFVDQQNQGWVGTINRLFKLNENKDSLIPFMDSAKIFQNGITCMRQMGNGIYTIGIRFKGIALMQHNNIIANITEADGLLSNSIKYLMPLKNQLWAATAKGISVINFHSYQPLKYSITNIGKNEGFYNIIINQLIPFQGNIMAATSNGIYIIEKPEQFIERTPQSLPLYINSVTYYKGDTSGISNITVPYKNNRLIIKYSAICFNSPEEVKYYYKLGINDTAWQTINGNELLLENLSPGVYELELKASIPNQHRFSGIQKLRITIGKPWWQNNWLRLAIVLLFVLTVYLFYKSRVNRIQKRERQKTIQHTKMTELEQTALRSQMNPHFIFNCLSSIQQLIVSGKVIEANEHLVKFARLIRKTLELSARPYIKIADEKEYLEEYLFLEQLRIPDQFTYHFAIDDSIDINKTEIPNMMLQPIVENCIRHGIKHLEGRKGNIIISMTIKIPGFIYCVVADNGVGRKISEHYNKGSFSEQKSYGLDIVKKRLDLLNEPGQDFASIEINNLVDPDGSAAGTEVIIQLPYKLSKI